ncbi:MAG: hypothetical protein AB1778_06730 [Candidatus Bipolaricaulota bacterium]
MARNVMFVVTLAAMLGLVAVGALGCDFLFSYESIAAPLGASGEIGVRVVKDHNNCSLPDPYDYDITVSGVQILAQTPWTEVQRNVIETWLMISLAEEGEGYVMVSKTCSKEGYEEARMPVTILPATDDGAWAQAWGGTYPFSVPSTGDVLHRVGAPAYSDGVLTVGGHTLTLSDVPSGLEQESSPVVVFYLVDGDAMSPLLIVGPSWFWRYDHLLAS